MLPFALLVALALPDSPPADALRFGVSRDVAAANMRTANKHRSFLFFQDDQFWTPWYFCQRSIAESWEGLDEALNPSLPNEQRLKALDKLRWIIGEDAYNAGHMPPPICAKGPWIPTVKGP